MILAAEGGLRKFQEVWDTLSTLLGTVTGELACLGLMENGMMKMVSYSLLLLPLRGSV
jgi:hypothetical protein